MDCNEARSALTGEREPDAARRAIARAHVAACAACQASADQLASAILSGADEELSCAECLARLDLQGAAILAESRPGRSASAGPSANRSAEPERLASSADALVQAHLARCPECAEAWELLSSGLADLAADRLPTPEAWPRFDLSFALDPAPDVAPSAGWWRRTMRRLEASAPALGIARLLAGLALAIVLGLAWLLRSGTSLPQQIRSLSPFDTPTPSQADIAATQTMAVEMGIDWVDAAGADGARTPTPDLLAPGSGRGTPTVARRASPSPTRGTGTAPAAGQRARDRERPATRAPEPTRVEPSAMITGTLRPRGNIAYPPPPVVTRDPYPGPGAPEPQPIAPTPGAATTPAPTPAPEPSLAPEPSAEPSPEP